MVLCAPHAPPGAHGSTDPQEPSVLLCWFHLWTRKRALTEASHSSLHSHHRAHSQAAGRPTVRVKAAQSCPTLCHAMDYTVHEDSPGQNTGVGRLSLLQGIFPTQGSSPGLPHCRRIPHQLREALVGGWAPENNRRESTSYM